MKFKMVHENYNVVDLDKSMEFYSKALGLKESRRKEAKDGSYIIVYMSNEEADFEFHLAFETDDMEAAHKLHEEMECICFENKEMGIYFIEDPDGYWLEIVPAK